MIRRATTADAAAIAAIYNHYVANTIVTFEEEAVPAADMAQRIGEVFAAGLPWLAATEGDRVLGYAYAGKWKARCSYRFSLETTVYLDPAATGRGLGTQLYTALIAAVRPQGMHALIGGVALPNAASVALHEKLGFQKVAHFREVGWKFNQWIDVGYWELLL
ncbi:arsinothricin resistance N-acetyltransferase ArsN1 family B [Opitutus sp. GAS368]|jgi:L-amino acid N-acyltransferase YncA|uniref:arsinothricin resistance N-acetyltransferase ArsN1 family B n=1 Tax=Opitutus sp. GAS368 TaxID=1882749 RepID=UPI00087B5C25|nr:arsinothricin resistance N-acetyltransferase ArsN1 family B [Opitutus sp. GAS368]SDR65217.1 phosphinothricin acetyltransferase [Opitutus sp. GAS368]